jgi:hypothetical protein
MIALRPGWSHDGKALTLFLQDTPHDDRQSNSGFIAVCEALGGEDFVLTTLYYDGLMMERSPLPLEPRSDCQPNDPSTQARWEICKSTA